MVIAGGTATLINCTFSRNTSSISGGGIGISSSTTSATNCILWNNTPNEIEDFGGEMPLRYCNVQGGWPGTGNIDDDPLFVDPNNGDFRLQAGSPCIDAGNNWAIVVLTDIDLDGNPRFADDKATTDSGCGVPVIVDMGAYEFQGTPVPNARYLGDLDADRVVGIVDFLALLGNWGPCEPGCCIADLDMDGDVGITDFLLLLGNWG